MKKFPQMALSLFCFLAIPAVAMAADAASAIVSTCDFNGVLDYFIASGVVKGTVSFVTIGVLLFFAFTKKNLPAVLKKVLDIAAQFLGRKPSNP